MATQMNLHEKLNEQNIKGFSAVVFFLFCCRDSIVVNLKSSHNFL